MSTRASRREGAPTGEKVDEPPIRFRRWTPDRTFIRCQAGVAVATSALMACSALTPVTADDLARKEADREAAARAYLLRAQERELALEVEVERAVDEKEGGRGTRAKGEEGSMGTPAGRGNGQRFGVAGQRFAREASVSQASEFGMIGLLGSGAAPSGTGPLGSRALRAKPVDGGGAPQEEFNAPTDPSVDPRSTFAVDVDTASYSLVRRRLLSGGKPQRALVRPEELINYFDYGYRAPNDDESPLIAQLDAAPSPFQPEHHLLRVGVQARSRGARKPVHLVYLVDTSGSMQSADRIGLAKQSLKLLTRELRAGDTVALCTYAGNVREVLAPTGVDAREQILKAIDELAAEGSTAMASGIDLAYRLAARHFVPGHTHRVIVLSDGDANVGDTEPDAILATIAAQRKKGIFLSTIGFGDGNYNDAMMERLADAGDGNYRYIDGIDEAKRVFVSQLDGMLDVVAKDVKVQVAFDPAQVQSYRLIGYENREVADVDFRNDAVDGGEVGRGHSVTALYDVVLRPFQSAMSGPAWATAHIRYKSPAGSAPASEASFPLESHRIAPGFDAAPESLRFASAVAAFAEILRESPHAKSWKLSELERIATGASEGRSERQELVGLVRRASASRGRR